jgi:hypothetical protein
VVILAAERTLPLAVDGIQQEAVVADLSKLAVFSSISRPTLPITRNFLPQK